MPRHPSLPKLGRKDAIDAAVKKAMDLLVTRSGGYDDFVDFGEAVATKLAAKVIRAFALDLETTLQGIRDEVHKLRQEESD